MSTIEIESKIRKMQEWEALAEEAKAEETPAEAPAEETAE